MKFKKRKNHKLPSILEGIAKDVLHDAYVLRGDRITELQSERDAAENKVESLTNTIRVEAELQGDAIKVLQSERDAAEKNAKCLTNIIRVEAARVDRLERRQAKTLIQATDESTALHIALQNANHQVVTLSKNKSAMVAESQEAQNEIRALRNRAEQAEYKVITTCNMIFELA